MRFRIGFQVLLIAVVSSWLLVLGISACSVATNEKETQMPEVTILPEPTAASSTKKVSITTSDGVELVATYFPPKNSNSEANVLLLLHEAYRDSRSWFGFGNAAREMGYAVLALDLRGHGQSGGELTFDEAMDNDVDAAIAWLRTSTDLNGNQIGIVGASLGANNRERD